MNTQDRVMQSASFQSFVSDRSKCTILRSFKVYHPTITQSVPFDGIMVASPIPIIQSVPPLHPKIS